MSTHLDVEITIEPDHVGVAREQFGRTGRELLGPSARRTVDVWQATVRIGRVQRPVSVSVGAITDRGSILWRTLRWRPERQGLEGGMIPDPRFPTFFGNLGLQTEPCPALILRGFYDPPGGQLGNLVDRMFLHKAAEATASDLLRDMRARLTVADTSRMPSPEENRR